MDKDSTAPDLIIISGLSGSGKSVALQSLEDIGYYCIDNLPAALLPEFTARLPENIDASNPTAIPGAAVSIDSRNKNFLSELEDTLTTLESQGVHYRILFLESEEQKIIKRYSETRRKHPLTDTQTPLIEGIRQELALLQPLHDSAEKIIDTTDTTPHELRGLIRDFAGGGLSSAPLFLIESFGFKHGTPREADFVFDVRCLPNPYWKKQLAPLSGLDGPVQEFFGDIPEVQEMTIEIFNFLEKWLPGFTNENRSYITVAIGCTGGQHRSVYISEQLRVLFTGQDIKVQVRHRELSK
jgi:UPF0042 nucleotide-binding protein